jgi:putative DNA methylase
MWMRDEAEKRIGDLCRTIEITPEMVAERPDLTPQLGRTPMVVARLWAHPVKSANPAFASVDVPLASTFTRSTKPGQGGGCRACPGNAGLWPACSGAGLPLHSEGR